MLNRLDRERASLERSLASLREACNRTVIPIQLPIGEEKNFRGVVDLVTRKAFLFKTDESGKFTEGPVPAEMTGDGRRRPRGAHRDGGRSRREADGEVLRSRHADGRGGRVRPAQRDGGRQAVPAGLHVGDRQHRHSAAARRHRQLPAVAGRTAVHGRRTRAAPTSRAPADEKQPPLAFVWKTIADPFAGRITMFRVVSGSLKADSTVHNKTRDSQERLGHLTLLQGKTQTNVPEIKAGDLGAVAKLKDTLTNDTLGDKADAVTFPADRSSRSRCCPTRSSRRPAATRTRSARRCTGSRRRTRRSSYSRDPQTKELLLSGQGQLHIEVTVAKLKRRFGVDVNLKPPRIPYRETIKALDRSARPPQEADRRPRPVRRLQDQGRAAAARRRFRVRRRHLRRLDPAPVRPGGREGHPGRADARLPRRLSRWSISA